MMQTVAAAQGWGLHTPSTGMAVQRPIRACSGIGAGTSGLRSAASLVPRTGLATRGRQWARSVGRLRGSGVVRAALQEQEQEKEKVLDEVEETTRKKGLEAGLWQIFRSKEKGGNVLTKTGQAKDLLTRYGGAYLFTSITLSAISFALCYVLVSSGVNIVSLLDLVGIHTSDTGEKVGTFALAYAAHKAASPIRFPPTVALTPIVAGLFRKKVKDKE